VTCRDLDLTLAAGHLLHARLATVVTVRPGGLDARADRWFAAERVAFDEAPLPPDVDRRVAELVTHARTAMDGDTVGGTLQLVHADLAGNVLLDAAGAPVVIDVAPAWRPAQWAAAVCVLDSVLWMDAPRTALAPWADGPARTALLRAIVFRLLSDAPPDVDAYAGVLSSVAD
jgi:Ser/Thr protein kinase RdoA (MazF antagonist)